MNPSNCEISYPDRPDQPKPKTFEQQWVALIHKVFPDDANKILSIKRCEVCQGRTKLCNKGQKLQCQRCGRENLVGGLSCASPAITGD
jgi:hypothetical protein